MSITPEEHHAIEYEVDGETQSTIEKTLTPTLILQHAGINPATHYLIELRGKHEKVSYQDRPDEVIHMHPGMKFVSATTAPTPIS